MVLVVKNLSVKAGDARSAYSITGLGRSPGCMATHSSMLVWRMPGTEEYGGLYSP